MKELKLYSISQARMLVKIKVVQYNGYPPTFKLPIVEVLGIGNLDQNGTPPILLESNYRLSKT